MKTILITITLVVTGLLVAAKFLPWWGTVLLFVGLVLLGKLILPRLLQALLITPFRMKGAVLKGAETEVHSVVASEGPDPSEAETRLDQDEPSGTPANSVKSEQPLVSRLYFWVEVTVTPNSQETKNPFQHWDPGELQLVRLDYNPKDIEDTDDTCEVAKVEVYRDRHFEPYEGEKYHGAQRLRLLAGVKSGVSRLKFHYYLETFGVVILPDWRAKAA